MIEDTTSSPTSGTIDIPVCSDEGETMANANATVDPAVLSQLTTMLIQSGNVAQNNFITVAKAFVYDFLEGKRVVDLVEALGVREVGSLRGSVPASSGLQL